MADTRLCYLHDVPPLTVRGKTACPACGTLYPAVEPSVSAPAQLPQRVLSSPPAGAFYSTEDWPMKKYLVTWNAGYGQFEDVVEARDEDDAEQAAYELWLETAQSNADYSATELTKELAEEYGLDWDEEE